MRSLITALAAAAVVAACTQTTQTPSPSPAVSPAASPVASPASPSPAAAGRVEVRVVTPENGARAGDQRGAGWTIDITTRGGPSGTAAAALPTATGTPAGTAASPTPARSPSPTPGAAGQVTTGPMCAQPTFVAQGQPGAHPAFPGLVVLLSTNSDPRQNLAGLFQIVALDDTERGRQCHAVWFVAQGRFGTGNAELTVFIVDGQAPASVPADRSGLRIISNEVTVRFVINGTAASPSPATSPSPTATPAGTPASPRPSPSPSPSPTRSP